MIEVRNGDFRFVVLPTRGMGFWSGKSRQGCNSAGNRPSAGPVHPAFVRFGPSRGAWVGSTASTNSLVRCGLESNGAPEFHPDGRLRCGSARQDRQYPLCTRSNLSIDGDSGTIALTGVVDESRYVRRQAPLGVDVSITQVGRAGAELRDTVTNLSAEPCDFELLDHVNFGSPLLEPLVKVVVPLAKVVPFATPRPSPTRQLGTSTGRKRRGWGEVCFFMQLAADVDRRDAGVRCKMRRGRQGVSLKFNTRQLPCFTIWKNCQAALRRLRDRPGAGNQFSQHQVPSSGGWAAPSPYRRAARSMELETGAARRRRGGPRRAGPGHRPVAGVESFRKYPDRA